MVRQALAREEAARDLKFVISITIILCKIFYVMKMERYFTKNYHLMISPITTTQ